MPTKGVCDRILHSRRTDRNLSNRFIDIPDPILQGETQQIFIEQNTATTVVDSIFPQFTAFHRLYHGRYLATRVDGSYHHVGSCSYGFPSLDTHRPLHVEGVGDDESVEAESFTKHIAYHNR